MGATVLAIFLLVYLGMLLGKLPGLALDRTGVALLGAIAMVSVGALPLDEAWRAVDVPTVTLLFALMVVSAQFRLAGFYSMLTRWITARKLSPGGLLGLVILASGGLSALLTNDVVCLAVTPVLIEGCRRRQLSPVPFLLGLACASNVGSAATLIGNPQNILIGQTLGLGFGQFLLDAGVPAGLGLGLTWAVIRLQYAARFHDANATTPTDPPPAYDRWQSGKAIAVCVVLIGAFCFLPELPRHGVALTGAGVLLLSRRMSSRRTLALVDWQLLVLFIGLFVVNAALAATGAVAACLGELRSLGLDVSQPAWLFSLGVVLSNLVSNVPATMLLLPAASAPGAGAILALSSTLAGNLLLVGSIANVIVVDNARALGVHIGVVAHLRTGAPVTLLTLLTAALWLALRAP